MEQGGVKEKRSELVGTTSSSSIMGPLKSQKLGGACRTILQSSNAPDYVD
ncbi:uncharacterized protein PHALS_08911 [Plasmopara halstedii]|uniref:Uncharacterized protein n=1 Tax=Plasmopara halstedii TaxID=4781 RepID=A0A0P1ADI8_PLAHL|nr:uncharacterized protein PHALS_08911 [Plasmopara halstedii]CEG38862.1 hypothetical protein PHALS_08911 [Plasmopara halstedii]|eukprot:XP_024575231.1 hypothetical protein PHALS_08911 [Plasmopara halstedii]